MVWLVWMYLGSQVGVVFFIHSEQRDQLGSLWAVSLEHHRRRCASGNHGRATGIVPDVVAGLGLGDVLFNVH